MEKIERSQCPETRDLVQKRANAFLEGIKKGHLYPGCSGQDIADYESETYFLEKNPRSLYGNELKEKREQRNRIKQAELDRYYANLKRRIL